MELFADRNLGRHVFPGVLRSAGLTVHVHDDHFPDDEPDESWLPEVAARRWIVLTSDRRILTRPLQVGAAMTSGAAVLILVGGSMKSADRAQNLVNTYAKVADFVARHAPPTSPSSTAPLPSKRSSRENPDRSRWRCRSTSGGGAAVDRRSPDRTAAWRGVSDAGLCAAEAIRARHASPLRGVARATPWC